MKLLAVFITGYVLSLVIHSRLIKRIKDTYDYVYKHNYSLSSAWYWAGRTL